MSLSRSRNARTWNHKVLPKLRVQHLIMIVMCLPVFCRAAEPVLPFQLSMFMANGWGGPIEPFPERHPGSYYKTPALQLSYSHPLTRILAVETSFLHLGVFRTTRIPQITTHEGEWSANHITEFINGWSVSPIFRIGSGSRYTIRTGPSLSWLGTDLRSEWGDEISAKFAPGFNLCADTRLANGLGLAWQYRFYHPERKSIHLLGVGLSAKF